MPAEYSAYADGSPRLLGVVAEVLGYYVMLALRVYRAGVETGRSALGRDGETARTRCFWEFLVRGKAAVGMWKGRGKDEVMWRWLWG